jgi:hypothetical protein
VRLGTLIITFNIKSVGHYKQFNESKQELNLTINGVILVTVVTSTI